MSPVVDPMSPTPGPLPRVSFAAARLFSVFVILAHGATQPADSTAIHFATGNSALAIPFELVNDHIYLKVSVNGSAPLSFVLDTGASQTVLSLRNAKSSGLSLQPLGKVEGGIGEPPDVHFVTDTLSLGLPGVVLSGHAVAVISLDMAEQCVNQLAGAEAPKRVIDGILGHNFFRSVVVEIDYHARVINLHAPTSYRYAGKGRSIPLEISPKHVFVRGQIKAPGRPPVNARFPG